MKRQSKTKPPSKTSKSAKAAPRTPRTPEFDATKRHAVTLTFLVRDPISPQMLAQKIASRCGGYELMPDEAIRVDHGKIACVVTDETLSLPNFGWEWHGSIKEPKRPKLRKSTCR